MTTGLKFKFSGGSQSLCWISRSGNLLWALELSQQCENVFSIILLQSLGHLLSGPVVRLMATSSERAYATCCVTQVYCSQSPCPQATADPCLCRRHSNTQRHVWLSLCGVSGSWCTQGFVCALQESVSPVLWKFCNQISLASKIKFTGGS